VFNQATIMAFLEFSKRV